MDPQQGIPQQDVIVGQTIGNYLVTQKLGEGGMGAVYLAEHPGIGKKVALKVLHSEFSENKDVADRFFNEAKAVNNIGHPNIVDIIDYGIIQTGRTPLVYFIMEYLSGITLSQLIRAETALAPERALAIALQVGDALAASHRCGIVHRDLKPDNIMLLQRGRQTDIVKLLDFGIAKLTSGAAGSQRTRTGIVMGTPAYMSPEQCDGAGNIDHRTDIYALGIVLYEMLVGRVPFIGEGYGEVLVQHLTRSPAAPSQFRIIQPHVEAIVLKALEKRVEMRYPNMEEMMRAMSDPVGYVESHGSLQGFLQYQLTPSNVPVTTSVRITTPPPLIGQPMTTPLPGAIPTPGPMQVTYTPTPPPGQFVSSPPGTYANQQYGHAAPTNVGNVGAVGLTPTPIPSTGGSKKLPIIIAAVVMVGVLVVAIVLGTRKKGSDEPVSNPPTAADADTGVATTPDAPEKKTVTPDAPDKVAVTPDAAEPGKGSDGSGAIAPKVATITLTTKPAGAKISLNGVVLNAVTPEPFEVPISDKPAKVILSLEGYKDIVFDKLIPNQNINEERTFVKKTKVVTPIPVVGKGSGSATNQGSNTKAGSGSGKKVDPDGLKRPE